MQNKDTEIAVLMEKNARLEAIVNQLSKQQQAACSICCGMQVFAAPPHPKSHGCCVFLAAPKLGLRSMHYIVLQKIPDHQSYPSKITPSYSRSAASLSCRTDRISSCSAILSCAPCCMIPAPQAIALFADDPRCVYVCVCVCVHIGAPAAIKIWHLLGQLLSAHFACDRLERLGQRVATAWLLTVMASSQRTISPRSALQQSALSNILAESTYSKASTALHRGGS